MRSRCFMNLGVFPDFQLHLVYVKLSASVYFFTLNKLHLWLEKCSAETSRSRSRIGPEHQ